MSDQSRSPGYGKLLIFREEEVLVIRGWDADPSRQPRSIESLLARLQKLHLEGVAIVGVPGARRLFPALKGI